MDALSVVGSHLLHGLPSLAGGIGLALTAHTLLTLQNRVLGISGMVNRTSHGSLADAVILAGVFAGGLFTAVLSSSGATVPYPNVSRVALAGFLVGLGSKLANGCTSGHFLCGCSRLSTRSLVATATFCSTGAITSSILHTPLRQETEPEADYFTRANLIFLALGGFSLAIAWLISSSRHRSQSSPSPPSRDIVGQFSILFLTGLSFALSLQVSRLADPQRVIGFLVLPFNAGFDGSLVFLALGALPLLAILYLTGSVKIASSNIIDTRLLGGAAIFGIGWAIEGVCPGPAVLNLGRAAIAGGGSVHLIWLSAFVVGSRLAELIA
ncbi:hypothetical protein BKA62DRAFT_698403 [Auriculariales sp. MPI-PUGE-AT-0066]|nr:hypothetical protein BKA62DRAFT_698403 [Auriculariales sp. MPI-PUGE-AT-0066]